jgi:lysophospholipase L1-like esterase
MAKWRRILPAPFRWLGLSLSALVLQSCATPADVFQNPSPSPISFGTDGSQLTYVVIGDSTGAGQGAPYRSGIAIGTAEALGKKYRVVMTNLSVSGARIADVEREQLCAAERLRPDLVLLSASANDVTHLTSISAMKASFLHIVRGLRAGNPDLVIVVTGSPDMGAPPRIPRLLRGLASRRTEAVNAMVHQLAAEEHLTVAPIAQRTGPLFRRDGTLFAADRFHPNARGYATWIAVLNDAIEAALRRTRRS